MAKRRTKKAYADLHDDPQSLFPKVETIIWPNGEPEIWFRTPDGLGFRVRVSDGKAGLGLRINKFVGGPGLDVFGEEITQDSVGEVSVVQYRQDEKAQAFRAWYRKDAGAPGEPPRFDEEVAS